MTIHAAGTLDTCLERADAVLRTLDPVASLLAEAASSDRLNYLRGIRDVRRDHSNTEWHSAYDPDKDAIVLYDKFFSAPRQEQVHMLLHEIGHRGQEVDKKAYSEFKMRHLNSRRDFLAMANEEHRRDYAKKGRVDSIAAETFAESYSRFCLGLPMPDDVRKFWNERVS